MRRGPRRWVPFPRGAVRSLNDLRLEDRQGQQVGDMADRQRGTAAEHGDFHLRQRRNQGDAEKSAEDQRAIWSERMNVDALSDTNHVALHCCK